MLNNPFATRYVLPDALPFFFIDDKDVVDKNSVTRLVDFFEQKNCRGQIIGNHGSGKTTLLAAIVDKLKKRNYIVCAIALHDQQRKLPREFTQEIEKKIASHEKIIIVDGFEQLSFLARLQLILFTSWRKCGLLITSHRRKFGLPILWQTKSSLKLTAQIVETILQKNNRVAQHSQDLLETLWKKHNGNVRLVLMSLYDFYEEVGT